MSEVKNYGDTTNELEIQDRVKCREIVNEIMNFGINQSQILQIMYLLSLEVDDINIMKSLTSSVKEAQSGKVKSSALIV